MKDGRADRREATHAPASGGDAVRTGGAGRRRLRDRRLVRALLAGLLVVGVPLAIEASAATGQRGLARIGRTPRLPSGALALGALPASSTVSGSVVLRPRNAAALERFIEAATNKSSPTFGHYLAKGQFAARFGPSTSTVSALRAQLSGAGLHVKTTSAAPLLVRFSGSAAAAGKAFATSLRAYRLPGGKTVHATNSAPALPAQLAGSVASVVGLDDLTAPHTSRVHRNAADASRFPSAKAARFAHPPGAPDACRQARADALEFGGLTDDQIAYAYGAFGLYSLGDNGSGVHIGVFEEEPVSPADLLHFDTCYFGAAAAAAMHERLHMVELEGGIPPGPGEDGEALLDVEDVSGMAPGADIDVYENAESAGGEVDEIAAMVDEDRDQIITSSYGQACEEEEQEGQPGTQQALNFLFQQGAAQGQTFLGAAGDNGSDNCEEDHREPTPQPGQNPLSGGEIASQPYVLGVGGTTITNAALPDQEHVWNDGDFGGAGGGGISEAFAMPSWQRDATVPGIELPGSEDYVQAAKVEQRFGFPTGFCDDTLATGPTTPCRLEPDVSAQSDEFTGAVTVYSEEYRGNGEEFEEAPDGWVTSGGTSSGTPIWAGMLALADASPTCRNTPATASGLGFILPLLYGVASNPAAYAASFNDITEGDNDEYGLDNGKVFPARVGYDLASGLGSPRLTGPGGAAGLAYYLCSYAAQSAKPVLSAISPASGSTAGGEKVQITGSGFEDVASVQVGTWDAPTSAFRVTSSTSLKLAMPPARETLPADTPPLQDGAGPVQVIVTLKDGQSSATGPASTFEYVEGSRGGGLASVSGVEPTGGSETVPLPVTILGSNFDEASSVSFGGVNATGLKLLNDSEIVVTPPAYSPKTACAPLPNSGVYAGENAGNDVCQVEVVVHDARGASATAKILPPVEGAPSFEQDGALVAPPGCGCEVYPAVSEYDYAPVPQISSVSTSEGPGELADEHGGTLVTIHGRGLNRFTFDYSSFGEPQLESSINLAGPTYISGTELQIEAPALPGFEEEGATLEPQSLPVSVRSLAGSSAEASVEYAGVPRVSSVSNETNATRLEGDSGASDTGGTPLALKGKGLAGQVAVVRFLSEGFAEGTQYTLQEEGESHLTAQTVSENPGLLQVQACTVTGCSAPTSADQLYLYPPGIPAVETLSPRSGKASGGTKVLISGKNLGCPLAVSFGKNEARSFAAVPGGPCFDADPEIEAVSPAGAAHGEVPVTVTTWESYFTGSGDAPSTALFTYR